ncbi:formin-like protein 5 isoform X2 [Panicum virgatum]|uniref:Uncharacterized protein n=1 Tax=Panicum virgatum TaxID=38727 RepID=A0A8T0UDA9_PANVG|nr:formin-like protein 5 isoform X2 [Panicum virgatum]XP_039801507.1 formin-like protein 5 isoform X2 [Panicum virgatum]XP_039801508.1 formin-like protein 5 isoform X2 [Panicum virgatum]XP_039801509.1 formin-like protein 5 isoform X2 [Panicum virgatum]KAG2620078.1 hypothetical protein PVAP13_3NG157100 [Panicum virgatum]
MFCLPVALPPANPPTAPLSLVAHIFPTLLREQFPHLALLSGLTLRSSLPLAHRSGLAIPSPLPHLALRSALPPRAPLHPPPRRARRRGADTRARRRRGELPPPPRSSLRPHPPSLRSALLPVAHAAAAKAHSRHPHSPPLAIVALSRHHRPLSPPHCCRRPLPPAQRPAPHSSVAPPGRDAGGAPAPSFVRRDPREDSYAATMTAPTTTLSQRWWWGQRLPGPASPILATFASAAGCLDVAFTHYSQAQPQPLLDAHPSVRDFHIDIRSGYGFEAISTTFGQVLICCERKVLLVGSWLLAGV